MNAVPTTQVVIGPNASLTVGQAIAFVGWTALVSFVIAGYFAARGFWPVLAFSAVEIAALAVALCASLRHSRYREVLHFDSQSIRVEFGELGRGARAALRLPRSPTRVLLEPGPFRNSPTRLFLACCGQYVELGGCLTDEERAMLATRMRELIHPGWKGGVPPGVAPRPALWVG